MEDYFIEKYYHHFFTPDKHLLSLLSELGLGSKIIWRMARTGWYKDGKVHPLNTPLEILKYPYLTFSDKVKLAILTLRSRRMEPEKYSSVSAKEFVEQYSQNLWENFFSPLLKSKFQRGDEISASWLISRVRLRSSRGIRGEKLGYLKGGFHQLVESLAENVEVRKGCGAKKIVLDGKSVAGVETERGRIGCRKIISTIPPFELNKILPFPVVQQPEYQIATCFLLGCDSPLLEDIYWLNLDNFPFGAIIEHTNFIPEEWYGENLIYLASYSPPLHPEVYLSSLEKISPGFRKKIKWWNYASWWAGPVYKLGYRPLPYETMIKGLYLAGMFSPPNYPERSMNGCVRAAQEVCSCLRS
jgi:protoporphyrinogen oxidase